MLDGSWLFLNSQKFRLLPVRIAFAQQNAHPFRRYLGNRYKLRGVQISLNIHFPKIVQDAFPDETVCPVSCSIFTTTDFEIGVLLFRAYSS